jgi:hypothetical protein
MADRVPEIRVRDLNRKPVRADGKYVLYWMIAAWNFAIDHTGSAAGGLPVSQRSHPPLRD